MTTFSQLVDAIVAESRRPDLIDVIASNLNFTIRELHIEPDSKRPIQFGANLVEQSLLANVEEGFVWEIPQAHLFQNLEAVYYPDVGKSPKPRTPGAAMQYLHTVNGRFYFYRTGDQYAFSGYGGVNSRIYIAYFQRLRRLKYIPKAQRKVQWDEEEEVFVYSPEIANDPAAQKKALESSTHWMLQRWSDLLGQGTRAKLFARLNVNDRARLAYSLYENMRPGLAASESIEYVPTWNT